MAAIAGKGGEARIAANTIAEVTSWSLDVGTDVVDTTAMLVGGAQWKTFISALNSFTISMELSWDVPTDTNGQTAMNTAMLAGTLIEDFNLYANVANYYNGDGIITSFGVATPVEDKITLTVEIQGTGALTYN